MFDTISSSNYDLLFIALKRKFLSIYITLYNKEKKKYFLFSLYKKYEDFI